MRNWPRTSIPALALAALFGCAGPVSEEPPAAAAADDPARRELLRAHIREQLGERYDEPVPPANSADLQRGAKIYDTVCASCHGRTGKGNGRSARLLEIRPPDLSDPVEAAFFSDQAKLHIIAEGLAGTPMIGWREMLSDAERLDVMLFMRSLVHGGS